MVLCACDGHEVLVSCSVSPIHSTDGALQGHVLVIRDISEAVALQEQLHHSQKMDAIGKLAGGIAHDFNNIIGGIAGTAEIMQNHADQPERIRKQARIILECAERAGDLTDQLLSFARKQPGTPKRVDVHHILRQTVALLKNTLNKQITLTCRWAADRCWVHGIPSQLQSAILNLCINASHAMPDGGELRVESENRAPRIEGLQGLQDGEWLAIHIADTGCGIAEENLPRIFEPFFTTKTQGEGTGLGLAAVHGTIKHHEGHVFVESRVGAGTTFHLFLPVVR